MMDRVLRHTGVPITVTFTVDGTPVDPSPDTATVVVTRSNGTVVYTGAAANDGTGVFSHVLTPADTALLDTLTATWSLMYGGETHILTTVVEIVGGFYFTVTEAQRLEGLAEDQYSTAEILEMRTLVEQAIDDAFGVSFVSRFARETVSGSGNTTVLLTWPRVTTIRAVSINATPVTPVSNVVALREGIGFLSTGFTHGYGNVTVEYEHGHVYPPERLRRGALRLARRWLVDGPVDDRRTFETTEGGTFGLLTPGRGGAVFDIPELEALRMVYGMSIGVA